MTINIIIIFFFSFFSAEYFVFGCVQTNVMPKVKRYLWDSDSKSIGDCGSQYTIHWLVVLGRENVPSQEVTCSLSHSFV